MPQFDRLAKVYNPTIRLSRRERKYCQAIGSLAGPVHTVLDVGGGTVVIAACFAAGAERLRHPGWTGCHTWQR